jgi:hypothetical protein
LTRDPFPGMAALPGTQNPYVYGLNNPANLTDPSGKFAFIPLLLVGLAGGALGGLGYYAIQSYMHADPCTGQMNWDWNQAAFWSGAGAVLGAAIGAGIYGGLWVGAQLGWWGQTAGTTAATAACADGDCTNEVRTATQIIGRIRVFWAGPGAEEAANAWAEANNATTLGMTEVGQRVSAAAEGLAPEVARLQWIPPSRDFAAGAVGEVHVFLSSAGVYLDSIWATVEYEALMANTSVTQIIYHVVMPNGTVVIVP